MNNDEDRPLVSLAWDKYPLEVLAAGLLGVTGTIFGAGFMSGRFFGKRAVVKAVKRALAEWDEEWWTTGRSPRKPGYINYRRE